ncbi:hypothetical protein [Caballeronia sp. TF1N1]|uniref:hypothetical protein n=1 Tax=Caballeronia sp. TF1N1 TaxID=2878153 RepID=UPI001FD5469D|nr:hypothetical protein [Caballeronia sp. TF1N1]
MPKRGRAFGTKDDYEHLSVDGDGLYWHGKKLKAGGMTTAEKIAFAALLTTAILTIVVNLDKIEARACEIHQFAYCPAPVKVGSPPAPAKQQG